MDARTMKKYITYNLLWKHHLRLMRHALDGRMETKRNEIGDILDMPNDKVTDKTMGRYNKTLRKMLESAESKLPEVHPHWDD